MGKAHQNIAGQMKTELEEPLAAFAGAMKERRKIVQGGIEKLLKVKIQQTQHVNKVRQRLIAYDPRLTSCRLGIDMNKNALK
jgi:anthranilate phosphoribosyltransferase